MSASSPLLLPSFIITCKSTRRSCSSSSNSILLLTAIVLLNVAGAAAEEEEEIALDLPGQIVNTSHLSISENPSSSCCCSREVHDIVCLDFRDVSQLCLQQQQHQQQRPSRPPKRLLISGGGDAVKAITLTTHLLRVSLGVIPNALEELRVSNNTSATKISFCANASEWGNMVPCEDFRSLRVLDLRGNSLRSLTWTALASQIWLSGNEWSCFDGKLQWMLDIKEKVLDNNETFCARPKSNKWHQSISTNSKFVNVTLFYFLEFNQEMLSSCPANCTCSVLNMNTPLLVKVSCSNISMHTLPQKLPVNTQDLDVSHNKLTSLKEVRTNSAYHHLKQLMAEGNSILTMSDLAGSPFLVRNNPTMLNLQYNQLTEFDVHLLEPTLSTIKKLHFQDSLNFLFAGNPWDCGCDSLQKIQNFVYEYKVLLRDADFLACGKYQNPYLISADFEALCQPAGVDYMLCVVAAEVFLLIAVLAKLARDTVRYQRTGELPWLARNNCSSTPHVGGQQQQSEVTGNYGLLCCCCHNRHTISNQEETSGDKDSSFVVGGIDDHLGGSLRDKRKKPLMDAFRPRRQTESSSTRGVCNTPVAHFSCKGGHSRMGGGCQIDEDSISLTNAIVELQ